MWSNLLGGSDGGEAVDLIEEDDGRLVAAGLLEQQPAKGDTKIGRTRRGKGVSGGGFITM